ncbi:MAG: tetratricopeptide repeat protein [candidate division Zixibacteria bacterium]|nr:tetratricopeptide repeat protein [candidate division Zixibacteria bacterium]
MLAVLPFENLGPTEEEYFADGMTEEIISRLAAVRDLGVISRTSAMQYKGTRKPIRQIAGELGVDYVLEGTVRWSKNPAGPSRVRITPQLIQVDDDTHLWSDRYDRVIEDIFAIQSEIAEQVIHQLNVTLRGPEREVVCAQCTSNVEAYQAYLRGLEYARHPDYQDDKYRSAIRLFEHAVSLDPEFAAAYAELSLAHSALYFFGFDRTAERLARSKSSADRALGLQPDLADARSALGFYLYRGHRDWEGALEQFQIAFRGKPNDSRILFTTGGIRRRQGRFAEARDNLMRAFPLDPRDARLPLEIGVTCLLMRQFEEAERFFDQSIALAPDQTNAYTWKSMLYLGWRGDLNAARHALESVLQPDVDATFAEWFLLRLCERDFQGTLVWLDRTGLDQHEAQAFFWSIAQLRGWLYDLLGDRTQAMAAYELARVSLEARREAQPDDFRVYSSLGSVYAGLGRPEEAVAAARRATELVPVTVDAVIGPFCLESLAHTCIRIGETELALDLLERLLAMPSLLSVSMLKIDPFLDPLRDYPRFHKLLAQPDKVF